MDPSTLLAQVPVYSRIVSWLDFDDLFRLFLVNRKFHEIFRQVYVLKEWLSYQDEYQQLHLLRKIVFKDCKDLEFVNLLLAAGINIAIYDNHFVMLVIGNNRVSIMKIILEYVTDIKFLWWAIMFRRTEIVKMILDKGGIDIHCRNDAAFRLAIFKGHLVSVILLIAQGGVYNFDDAMYASCYYNGWEYAEVGEFLRRHGATDIEVPNLNWHRELRDIISCCNGVELAPPVITQNPEQTTNTVYFSRRYHLNFGGELDILYV